MGTLSSKHRGWLYITVVLSLFSLVLFFGQLQSERNSIRTVLQSKFDSYADILAKSDDYVYTASLLPSDIRVTGMFSFILIFIIVILLFILLSVLYNKKAEEVENQRIRQLKQEMTSNISHELKTPVSSIRGYLETLVTHPDLDEQRRNFFIERSYQQSLRLSELIRDISIINKIEEAPEQFKIEDVNLHTVAEEVLEEFKEKIADNGQTLENLLPEEICIQGNYSLLYSLIRNLVENSVKYAGRDAKMYLECNAQGGKFYHFVFYDTGKGIEEQYISRIFDRFFRIDEGRTSEAGGSGLGLAIVRNAVHFHKGTISVRNRSEHGLEFFFSLAKKSE